jgi:hypothetical protein
MNINASIVKLIEQIVGKDGKGYGHVVQGFKPILVLPTCKKS